MLAFFFQSRWSERRRAAAVFLLFVSQPYRPHPIRLWPCSSPFPSYSLIQLFAFPSPCRGGGASSSTLKFWFPAPDNGSCRLAHLHARFLSLKESRRLASSLTTAIFPVAKLSDQQSVRTYPQAVAHPSHKVTCFPPFRVHSSPNSLNPIIRASYARPLRLLFLVAALDADTPPACLSATFGTRADSLFPPAASVPRRRAGQTLGHPGRARS